ncbi:MAG TPA: hypothetical protein PLF71_02920 [bacterium]|nr:MAG: hypothetical protein BWY14_00033 [Parcubacteria group bacterium ADurb.Bin192]HPN15039.1 hypothetical protein [bacterium]
MADSPDLFSFIGDWSAAADQFLASNRAGRLQMPFTPQEREIVRLMLHGSIRPPLGVSRALSQEADAFRQRAMEECEKRLRGIYSGPLIGSQFLRRLEEIRLVVEGMIPEVVSLRDFGTMLQEEFPGDDDVRITREFPSGIFTAMDEYHASEVETGKIEAGPVAPVPTIPAPKPYPEALKPQAGKQSGLHHLLSDKPDKP